MFLHGNGRTNMIFRSSLLGNSKEDIEFEKSIKHFKPTKIIINPPYENSNPIKFTEQAIKYLETNGKLIIIMPSVTLDYNEEKFKEILEVAKLDFVIKLPIQIFKEQKRDVYTSIFGFTKTQHNKKLDEVLFYELKDDGLVTVQHKGRIDKNNKWQQIEDQIVESISNLKEIEGVSEKRKIYYNGELISYGVRKDTLKNKNLVKFSELFTTNEKGKLASEKNNCDGEYDFITCSEVWKKHDKFQTDKEAIVYAVGSEGSLGRAHYVNGKFMASTLCLILTPNNMKKYPIDLEFYTYYLMSIKKKIANDLGEGTSKKTIKPDKLKNYYIEYIPYKKQLQLKAEIKRKEEELKQMENKIKEFKENYYNGISNI